MKNSGRGGRSWRSAWIIVPAAAVIGAALTVGILYRLGEETPGPERLPDTPAAAVVDAPAAAVVDARAVEPADIPPVPDVPDIPDDAAAVPDADEKPILPEEDSVPVGDDGPRETEAPPEPAILPGRKITASADDDTAGDDSEGGIDPDGMRAFMNRLARSLTPPPDVPAPAPEDEALVAVLPDRIEVEPDSEPEVVSEPAVETAPPPPEAAASVEPAGDSAPASLPPAAVETELEPEPEPEEEPAPPPPPPPPPEEPAAAGNLVLDAPYNGAYYTSLVEFRGTAEDFTTLEWSSRALDSGGVIPIAEDGGFVFNVSTHKHSEDVDITVSGTDALGELREVTLTLVNDGVGPSLDLLSPGRGDYYDDEIAVSGRVGAGPWDPPGIGEVESLTWALEGETPRPVFFGADGSFDFRADMGDRSGRTGLDFVATDLNGNETRKTVILQDGRLAPELTLRSIADGDEYGAGIRLAGTVIDPYGGRGELGGIESLKYEILASDAVTRDGIITGDIRTGPDGTFDVSVMTGGLRGAQDVTLVVIGLNGRRTYRTFTLRQGRSAIPDFNVRSEDRSVLARWSPVPTAGAYRVTVLGDDGTSVRHDTTGASLPIRGLENGREYRFRVDAVLENGTVSSHEVTSIPLSEETLRPRVTGEFRRIRISWESIPGAGAYAVLRSESPDGPFEAVAGSVEGDTYLDTVAAFGTRYWYAVAPSEYPELMSGTASGESLATQARNVERVGTVQSLSTESISIEGEYAFIASRDSGLVLVDITEPARPVTVGRADIPGARDVSVAGSYAYVAAGESGLKVVNIDDPGRPLPVGSRRAGDASAVVVSGQYAFVADRQKGLRVLDVSDAADPVRITATDGLEGRDLILDGTNVYLAAGDDGVVVFDVSVPRRPRETGRFAMSGAETVLLRDSLLAAGGSEAGIAVFDAGRPGRPALSRLEGMAVMSMESSEDFLMITTCAELILIDIRDPSDPYVFQTYPVDESTAMAVHGDSLLVAADDGLGLYQTYLVGHSFVIGEAGSEGRSYGISRSGEELLVSSHTGGIVFYDGDLNALGRLPSDFAEAGADAGDNGIVVADGLAGVRILSREASSSVLFENTGFAHDAAYADGTAYAAVDSGVLVIRFDEGVPRTAGTLPLESCRSIAVGESLVFAGGGDVLAAYAPVRSGLPVEASRFAVPGIRAVAVSGDTVAAVGADGAVILDYGIASRPRVLGRIPLENAESVTLEGNYLYLSAGYRGLQIYDLRRPSSPKMVSSCDDVFALEAVVSGETAWVVDGDGVKKVSIFIPHWLR